MAKHKNRKGESAIESEVLMFDSIEFSGFEMISVGTDAVVFVLFEDDSVETVE